MNAPSAIMRPKRWDQPFSSEMDDLAVERVLRSPPFCDIDPADFSRTLPLSDIIRNDGRLVRYSPGDIIVRQGDYGHSVYVLIEGEARVILASSLSEKSAEMSGGVLGNASRATGKRGWWRTLGGLARVAFTGGTPPESRDLTSGSGPGFRAAGVVPNSTVTLDEISTKFETVPLHAGESFGEIAALSRTPRTATVVAQTDVLACEVRWQGLRDIRSRSERVREQLDRLYRDRSLAAHLRENGLFAHLSDEQLDEIAAQTNFETHGSFTWHAAYKSSRDNGTSHGIEREPVIVGEGDIANGLVLIRTGFARESHRLDHGHRTVRYLGRGQCFGLDELMENWRDGREEPFRHTLRALGYVDVLVVPTSMVERYVLPRLADEARPKQRVPKTPLSRWVSELARADPGPTQQQATADEFLEQLVEQRFINGTATMMINLDRCTRCDDCVRACADAHDGNPRFLRHGPEVGRFMIANACMHCADPVCLIGCPSGAIQRVARTGDVVITDDLCIGCATCANSCPYDNIRMVEISDRQGNPIVDESTEKRILKATKCDLCSGQLVTPACQNACPHGALRRVDFAEIEGIKAWVGRE